MLFLILLCVFLLVLNLCCFAFLMKGRLSHSMVLGICIVSFVISALFPLRYVLCNPFIMEQISVTALHEKNDASLSTDVAIQYIDSNYSERRLENPVEGRWAWWNGTYKWSERWEEQGLYTTDTIVMKVPVGYNRNITFVTGSDCGMAEVSCLGNVQSIDLYNESGGTLSVELPDSLNKDFVKDGQLRAVVFVGMEILIILLVTIIAVFLNKKINWHILLKWKYEAFVFLLSLLNVVFMGSYPNLVDYPISYYLISYERGFASRGLTGAVAAFFGGPFIEQNELATSILMILILTYLFGSILIVSLAKRESDWRMGVFWVLLYLLTPMIFLQIPDGARPDIYLIILFVIGVIIINKNHFLQCLPIICVVMVLINETSSVFFVAPMLVLLLYFILKERDVGYFISFSSSTVFTCITTLKIMRLDKEKLMPLDSFFSHMLLHTNAPILPAAFKAEYKNFNDINSDFAYAMGNQFHQNNELLINTLLYFVMIIPFVILFAILWKAVYTKLIIQYSGEKASLFRIKLIFWILLLSSCGGVVCMLMAYDYLRFTEFIMIAALANMFTLIHKEKLVLKIDDLYLFTSPKGHFPMIPFAILLYMKFWGTIDVWPRNTQILSNLFQIIKGFFN